MGDKKWSFVAGTDFTHTSSTSFRVDDCSGIVLVLIR